MTKRVILIGATALVLGALTGVGAVSAQSGTDFKTVQAPARPVIEASVVQAQDRVTLADPQTPARPDPR